MSIWQWAHKCGCPDTACLSADYADSTVDLIEALSLPQPDVLGWSLGGFITLTLVEDYPELVNKIVLVDTSSGGALGKLLYIASKITIASGIG